MAALGVDGIVGEATGAGHMRPGQLPTAPHAGLVVVQHSRALQHRLELRLHGLEHVGRALDPPHQRAPS
jgi:L-asparaginase/Glu-tRNA(Gln) amidotransferase subunit D